MKVLNLRCANLHGFEGWFASEDDFQSQRQCGLVECPFCADGDIQKMPTAPRLNFGGHASSQTYSPGRDADRPDSPGLDPRLKTKEGSAPAALTSPLDMLGAAEQMAFLAALRQVIATTEDVGPNFAEEARRMHYDEAPGRNIRGQASAREAAEMREEGIDIMALPMLPAAAKTLH